VTILERDGKQRPERLVDDVIHRRWFVVLGQLAFELSHIRKPDFVDISRKIQMRLRHL
jgi:hypothetical protein